MPGSVPRPRRLDNLDLDSPIARLILAVLFAVVLSLLGCGGTDPADPQPLLTASDPDSGTVGTMVVLTGASFQPGCRVAFDSLPAEDVTFVSPTTVLAYAPDGVTLGGIYTITVTNPGGKADDLADTFVGVEPELEVVNGVTRPSGQVSSVILFEGKSFGDLLGKGHVWFTDGGGQPVEGQVSLDDNWNNEYVVTVVPSTAVSGAVWIETPTGVSNSIRFTVDEGSSFSPSDIFWTETSTLPVASQGHRAVFLENEGQVGVENVIYLTGGADGALHPRADVWRSGIEPGGHLSGWAPLGSLPDARACHGMAVATPYNALLDTTVAGHLFVVGGVDSTGWARSTVFRAPVHLDRSVGSWLAELDLPQPLHSMGIVVHRSWIYVVGGAGEGNVPTSSVYRARIHPDGSLGLWESQPSLPGARAYPALVTFGGILYAVAGDGGTEAPGTTGTSPSQSSSVFTHDIALRTGELSGPWADNPSSLIKPVAKHSALVAGGQVLVSGGLYNGAGSSATEHQYSGIQLDGTLGSFNGATGSQTVQSQGGVPFFNHAVVGYVDGNGIAHVIILGGNDVNAPATPTDRCWFY